MKKNHEAALQVYKNFIAKYPEKREAAREKFEKQMGFDPEEDAYTPSSTDRLKLMLLAGIAGPITGPLPLPPPLPYVQQGQKIDTYVGPNATYGGPHTPKGGRGGLLFEPAKAQPLDTNKLEALKTVEPHRVHRKAPDYVECITGWRAWAVTAINNEFRLKALGQSQIWEPKKQMAAECAKNDYPAARFPSAKHPAPQMECACGVWSFKDLDTLTAALERYNDVKVLGTVSLWGRVIETENGWRAQYAYPNELWLFDNSLEELGLIYDVPVRTLG